jgi:hypothetical protein
MTDTLQELFLESGGNAVEIDGKSIVQMDQVELPNEAKVEVSFIGPASPDDAAVIAIGRPGAIFLSDGRPVTAVQIWAEPEWPRTVVHRVEGAGQALQIYNKYRIQHGPDFVTEDSFTGNAGMIVTQLSANHKRYECSNGLGRFSPSDLIFELSWKPPGN